MKIGYPCINRSIGCTANRTFRLASYSEERLLRTVEENLACLKKILEWNRARGILFFRITSDLVPFASHPVCMVAWQDHFRKELEAVGALVTEAGIRISMHPDQFIVLNALDQEVVSKSVAELGYHARLLDAMGLDDTAKIQLHVGGVYGNRRESIARFVRGCRQLGPAVRRRLVIENDDSRFTAADCLSIAVQVGIPVLFDVFHHACLNNGEDLPAVLASAGRTWKASDGLPMVDYSSRHPAKRPGSHADHIDAEDFRRFLAVSAPHDMDVMLEIKDKEKSALAAVAIADADPRFVRR